MASRTFGVKRAPATYAEEVYNNNLGLGKTLTFPGGEYQDNASGMYPRNQPFVEPSLGMDDMDIDGVIKDETIGPINSIAQDAAKGAVKPGALEGISGDEYPKDPKTTGAAQRLKAGAAVLDTVSGVVNEYSKHANFVSANNLKIMQAKMQEGYIQSDAARAMLREGTKANDRKGQALLNAVAQGQSATGDLAQTAMSNEDVYAAQNAMNIEINAMRAIYGLQSEQLTMESNSRLSKIQRDHNIVNQIAVGGIKAAAGYAGA